MLGYILHHLEQLKPVVDDDDDLPVLGAKSIEYMGRWVVDGALRLASRGWRDANPADLQCYLISISILNTAAQLSYSVSPLYA